MEFTLSDLRKSLDNLDKAIVVLLAERFRITRKIGILKAKKGLPARDKAREKEKLESLSKLAKDYGISSSLIREIFKLIMTEVVKKHRQIKTSEFSK